MSLAKAMLASALSAPMLFVPSRFAISNDEASAATAACEDQGKQAEWLVDISGRAPVYYVGCRRRFDTDGLGTRPWNWRRK